MQDGVIMRHNSDGIMLCEHCGKPFADGQTVYGYKNTFNNEVLYFCHGVCAGAWLSGSFTRYEIKPSMVTTHKYTRPASSKINYAFTAWVHPKGGGDDYAVQGTMTLPIETKNPDEEVKKEIAKILKRRRSAILDDYSFKRV
jgi:hypothetical protein